MQPQNPNNQLPNNFTELQNSEFIPGRSMNMPILNINQQFQNTMDIANLEQYQKELQSGLGAQNILNSENELKKKFDAIMNEVNIGNNTMDDFKSQQLPIARIKKIMKSDEDVKMISAEVPVLFAKACELFITELTHKAWNYTESNKRRTLQRVDITYCIQDCDIFDFLIDLIPKDEFRMTTYNKSKKMSAIQQSMMGNYIRQDYPHYQQQMPFQNQFGLMGIPQQMNIMDYEKYEDSQMRENHMINQLIANNQEHSQPDIKEG